MENNFEKSTVKAGQSDAHPTPSQPKLEKKQEALEMFWRDKQREMENVNNFENNMLLPPNCIKTIMKMDKDACELFIQELTLLSWFKAEKNCRRTLKKNDIIDVIIQTDTLDFLLDDDINASGGSTPSGVSFYAAGGSNGRT
nr:nuclear transcription factor Y subunit C-1-like [Solanum lycopersicum]